LIVADFPALFAEFGGKQFTLLWRGSRDGHNNTLTLAPERGESNSTQTELGDENPLKLFVAKATVWSSCFSGHFDGNALNAAP
jgi:hypothetical protein